VSSPVVEWVLDQLESVVDAQPDAHPLKRVNRDESRILEGDIRSRTGELRKANFVGAAHVDHEARPIGTEYDLDVEDVVGIRIEGLTYTDRGHVDPDGQDGVVFSGDPGLVQDLKAALYDARTFPDAGRTPVNFTDLRLSNHAPQSHLWSDYFRYDFDVVFEGYEELP
jgi:hypothetical protein